MSCSDYSLYGHMEVVIYTAYTPILSLYNGPKIRVSDREEIEQLRNEWRDSKRKTTTPVTPVIWMEETLTQRESMMVQYLKQNPNEQQSVINKLTLQ